MLHEIAFHSLGPSLAIRYLKNGSGLLNRFFRAEFAEASTESHGKALRSQLYSTIVPKKISNPPKAKSQKPVPEKTPPKKVNTQLEAKAKKVIAQKTPSPVHKKTRSPKNVKLWSQFEGFKHNPRARFNKEWRLKALRRR